MTNGELVSTALAAARSGDAAAAAAHLSANFAWRIPGSSPIAGTTHGAAEWVAKFHRLLGEGLHPEIEAVLEGERHVVTIQRNRATSGEHRLDVRVVNVFEIEGARIVRMDTFFDDQAVLDRFWSVVLPEG